MLFAQAGTELASALLKFYSKEDIATYLRSLVENYKKQADQQGDQLGTLLRVNPQQSANVEKTDKGKADKAIEGKKVTARGWIRTGSMLFNVSDPVTGTTEVMFQMHEETKQKLARTAEALKSFEEAAGAIIPEGATYVLYLRNGVPERIILDVNEKKNATFNYTAKFRLA